MEKLLRRYSRLSFQRNGNIFQKTKDLQEELENFCVKRKKVKADIIITPSVREDTCSRVP